MLHTRQYTAYQSNYCMYVQHSVHMIIMPKSKQTRGKRRCRHKSVQRRKFRVQIGANLLPIVDGRKHDDLKIQTDMLAFNYEDDDEVYCCTGTPLLLLLSLLLFPL